MSVIQAIGQKGKTIATLVNYAIHPEVLGNDVGILSPDLIGPMNRRIEALGGGMALFMNSAQGGMVTADNRNLDQPKGDGSGYWKDSRTWNECLRIGNTMADEALRIIQEAPVQKHPALFCAAIDVRFPVTSDLLWKIVVGSPLKYPHNKDQSIIARINLVNLGNAQMFRGELRRVLCPKSPGRLRMSVRHLYQVVFCPKARASAVALRHRNSDSLTNSAIA